MAERKTDRLLITEVGKNIKLPPIRQDRPGEAAKSGQPHFEDHVVWLDDSVIPDARIYSECMWFWPGPADQVMGGEVGLPEHTHPFDEVLAFFGGDLNCPRDLGADLQLSLDGETHLVSKTSLVFIPAGMRHGPISYKKITKPVFHFSIGASNQYKAEIVNTLAGQKAGHNTGKYVRLRLLKLPMARADASSSWTMM